MSLVKVEKPNARRIDELKIKTWPVWEKGISRFEWSYEEKEVCYFLEGAASVECPDGSVVSFGYEVFLCSVYLVVCYCDARRLICGLFWWIGWRPECGDSVRWSR